MAESITTLKAQLAEANERNRHQDEEWDYLIRDTLTLHDHARHVHGTSKLMLEYINESEIIMRNLGYAQESTVLKNLFNELASRLRRQREACQRAVEGMGGHIGKPGAMEGQGEGMTNPLTESDLSAIEARCEAATPGKWFVYHADAGPTVQVPKGWVALLDWKCCGGTLDQRANATFIAAAREDVLRLVAEVRRLRALIGKGDE